MRDFLRGPFGRITLIAIFYLLVFGLVCLITGIDNLAVTLISGLCFTMCGWKKLNSITPTMFLFLPIGGWLVYFGIKFILSFIIGIFAAPFVFADKVLTSI